MLGAIQVAHVIRAQPSGIVIGRMAAHSFMLIAPSIGLVAMGVLMTQMCSGFQPIARRWLRLEILMMRHQREPT